MCFKKFNIDNSLLNFKTFKIIFLIKYKKIIHIFIQISDNFYIINNSNAKNIRALYVIIIINIDGDSRLKYINILFYFYFDTLFFR